MEEEKLLDQELDLLGKTMMTHEKFCVLLGKEAYQQNEIANAMGISVFILNRFYRHPKKITAKTLRKIMRWCDLEEKKMAAREEIMENKKKEFVEKLQRDMLDGSGTWELVYKLKDNK